MPEQAVAELAPSKQSISYSFAKRHGVLIERGPDANASITVLHYRPLQAITLAEIQRLLKKRLQLREISNDMFEKLLTQYYEDNSEQTSEIMNDIGNEFDIKTANALIEPEDLLESKDDAPIIQLINAVLSEAVRKNASDIHIEPYEKRLVIRFRIDGVMTEIHEPPRAIAALMISRIKIMAKLDITEKRLPQDGRISLRVANRPIDVRVSTLPSGHGERVVLRLLDKQTGRLDLEHLGMSEHDRVNLETILKASHGIILVTGPTGSGKTTSLYAAISRLNARDTTILTIEDPIEYHLDGVGQTQVNPKVDLDFARGLRAILRQDPDVVMVGEIRDIETAEIAIQSSLTGHLVLSTLHTNSAIGSVTRLRDMGIEPFLLASSLIGVLAQRLIRLLCSNCKQPYEASHAELETMGLNPKDKVTLYEKSGCEMCNHSGFTGRTGIYEVINIDKTMRTMIHDNASESAMERHARTTSPSITQDGYRRVLAGESTLQEITRVSRDA